MKRILSKIIAILLVLILFIGSSPIILRTLAADYSETKLEYATLTDYLSANEYGIYEVEGEYRLILYNVIIKDFSDVSNYTNLNEIYLQDTDIGNVDNVKFPVSVKYIQIYGGSMNGTLSLTANLNLEDIDIVEDTFGSLSNTVIDIRGLENLYRFRCDYITSYDGEEYEIDEKILMDDYSLAESHAYWSSYNGEEITGWRCEMHVYNNMDDYFEKQMSYEYENKTEVTELNLYNGVIKDISDISEFSNLETLEIYGTILGEGTFSFSNNKKLKEISISFAEQDLSNIVIDIRNMDWLKAFGIYSNYSNSGFELDKNLLMDDWNILDGYGGSTFYFSYRYFENIDKYLEYYGETKEEIEDFYVSGSGDIISDLSDLKELTNLKSLHVSYMDLQDVSFIEELTNLEKLYINNCTLNTTLDLTKHTNLKEVRVQLEGDLSNSCIDITGLENLEDFWYVYDIENTSNFDLNTCIKTDLIFQHYESDGIYETYFWSNNGEYYLDYNKIEDYETEEGIELLFGFNLNNGKITADEIISDGYFLDGIEAKVYSASDELLTGDDIVGSGCKVKMFVNNELKKEYNIVIFGDTTGDGVIAAYDALTIIMNKNKKVLINNPVLEAAGSVTHNDYIEDTPSAVEALAIIKYLNGKYNIEQYLGWYGMRRLGRLIKK